MAEIQIQPKSAKHTKGLGRPDTVGEPSSVRIMKAAATAVVFSSIIHCHLNDWASLLDCQPKPLRRGIYSLCAPVIFL
jgi:hypothetical protein